MEAVRIGVEGYGYGVWRDDVSMSQNYDITTMIGPLQKLDQHLF